MLPDPNVIRSHGLSSSEPANNDAMDQIQSDLLSILSRKFLTMRTRLRSLFRRLLTIFPTRSSQSSDELVQSDGKSRVAVYTHRQQPGWNLLDLPYEVRLLIYECCIPEEILISPSLIRNSHTSMKYDVFASDRLWPSIFGINKQMRDEVVSIYWKRTTYSPTHQSLSQKLPFALLLLIGQMDQIDKSKIQHLAFNETQTKSTKLSEYPKLRSITFKSWLRHDDLLGRVCLWSKENKKTETDLPHYLRHATLRLADLKVNEDNLISSIQDLARRYQVYIQVTGLPYNLKLDMRAVSIDLAWKYCLNTRTVIYTFEGQIRRPVTGRSESLRSSHLEYLLTKGSPEDLVASAHDNDCQISDMVVIGELMHCSGKCLICGGAHKLVETKCIDLTTKV